MERQTDVGQGRCLPTGKVQSRGGADRADVLKGQGLSKIELYRRVKNQWMGKAQTEDEWISQEFIQLWYICEY